MVLKLFIYTFFLTEISTAWIFINYAADMRTKKAIIIIHVKCMTLLNVKAAAHLQVTNLTFLCYFY